MGGAGQLCCPGVLLFFGALILMQGTGGKKKIDAIQAKLVDNSFIEGDDVQEDSCSETGIVTCEMTQAEQYKSGSAEQNGTDWSKGKGGLPVDIYVYSVANVEDVIAGEKPRLMTVGPFEFTRQSPDKIIDSFTDGTVTYKSGAKYFFRKEASGAPDSSEQELLDHEVIVPNAFYAILLANTGLEQIVLSQVAGQHYQTQPGVSWSLLKTNLAGAGSLSDAEIELAFDGLLAETSQSAIGQTVSTIASTWAPEKQTALFSHIGEIAYATAKAAYGTTYGTGVALPMFIKMTAAEFLGWDGAAKQDPIGKANVGLNLLKPSMPENKKGFTVVRTGAEKWGAKFHRWVVQDNGVQQRCNFDKDCMKQDKYKQAYAESKARDQCDAGVDHCDPLVVEGYQAGKALPATLFGSEVGSDEHGEGSTAVVYVSGVGRVQLRNTGLKDWDGVKHNRWVLDKVLDRRENCNAEEEGSVGIDCDSPLTTWTLAPWYGDPAPPVYASLLEFKIPAESMYASSGKSSPTDLKMGSVVLTEYGQTLTNTQGPYDPAEKVVFLSPLSVAPDIFLDSDPETGTIIRASKPLQVSIRMKNSMLFPDVGDVLIPLAVQNEYAGASAGARKTLRSLQKAGRQEVGTIVFLTGLGSMLVAIGGFMCLFRIPGLVVRKLKPQTEEVVVLDRGQ